MRCKKPRYTIGWIHPLIRGPYVNEAEVKHILGVDEQNGEASMTFYIELQWKDPRLVWSYNETVNDYLLSLDEDEENETLRIWTPKDVSFGYNVISATAPSALSDLAHVCHDGTVTTNKLQQFSFSCYFTNMEFPFDTQVITTMYGSPFAGKQEIDMITNIDTEANYADYNWYVMENAEWELQSIKCQRVLLSYNQRDIAL